MAARNNGTRNDGKQVSEEIPAKLSTEDLAELVEVFRILRQWDESAPQASARDSDVKDRNDGTDS